MILTIVGVFILLMLVVLVVSLVAQFWEFLSVIGQELSFRFSN